MKQLSTARIVGYGIGDLGFNLFYTGLNLYLLYYYTDVLGIAPAIAGLIFMLPVVWDGITDPIMGWIASRTRTRWGSYRPFILFGAPLLSLSFVLMFAAPLWFPGAVALACALSHMIFRTAYTIVSIPYTALSAAMTEDGPTRSSLAGMRMLAAISGGLLTAFLTFQLAGYFGNGDLAAGFVSVAALYGVVSLVIMLVVFLSTEERSATETPLKRPSTAQTLHFLSRNSAFWLLFAAVFAGSLGSSISSKALVYYISYYVGDPSAVSGILTATLATAGISVAFWAYLARKLDKKTVWQIAGVGGISLALLQLWIAPQTASTLLWFQIAGGWFAGGFAVIFWAMLPDTVEFGEWHSGVRDEGIAFGLNQLALKASSGLGVGALGVLLGAIGYVAGEPQTPEAREGLRWLAFAVPAVSGAVALTIISFYPVSASIHRRLIRVLNHRRRSTVTGIQQ